MRIALAGLLLFACGTDDGGGAGPAAPTNLMIEAVLGGANLTWIDNSDDEDEFVIMRKAGAGSFARIDAVPESSTSYQDDTVAGGTTYIYRVVAKNEAGESASADVMFTF